MDRDGEFVVGVEDDRRALFGNRVDHLLGHVIVVALGILIHEPRFGDGAGVFAGRTVEDRGLRGVDVDQGVVHAEGPEGRHNVLDGADTVAAGFDRRAARGVHHVVAKCRDLRLSFDIGAAEYDAPAGFCGMDRHRHLHARMQSLSRERDRGLQRLLFR